MTIERAALTRVNAVSDPRETESPEYVEGLQKAVAAAIDYGIAGIGSGLGTHTPVPVVLLEQARLAARNGVSLDTVLRRYVAGYTLLGDFLIEEARKDDSLRSPVLQRVLRDQAILFERLVSTIIAEYGREVEKRNASANQRRAERVRTLLDGELVDTSEFAYDFGVWHLGMVVAGPRAEDAIRYFAEAFGRRILLVRVDDGITWAWLGGEHRIDPLELEIARSTASNWPSQVQLAVGEPGHGMEGWRFTHQQARAVLPIVLRSEETFIRYADVAVLTGILQDDLLAISLRELYLEPLEDERDGGSALRATLRAYFSSCRNVSSAAATLGLNRRTVASRLRTVEERLGRQLDSCAADLETALRMEELDIGHSYPASPTR
jgi:PucR-like helix-turn-helix protein/diguanylate cyclase with GGDEF domain